MRRPASPDPMSVLLPILRVLLGVVEAAVAVAVEVLVGAAVARDLAQGLPVWPGCKRCACW